MSIFIKKFKVIKAFLLSQVFIFCPHLLSEEPNPKSETKTTHLCDIKIYVFV